MNDIELSKLVVKVLISLSFVFRPQSGDHPLIEGVQRTFTSRISGLQHLNYWERLAKLKLMRQADVTEVTLTRALVRKHLVR